MKRKKVFAPKPGDIIRPIFECSLNLQPGNLHGCLIIHHRKQNDFGLESNFVFLGMGILKEYIVLDPFGRIAWFHPGACLVAA